MTTSYHKVIKCEHMASALVEALSTLTERHHAFGGRKRNTKEQIKKKKGKEKKLIK